MGRCSIEGPLHTLWSRDGHGDDGIGEIGAQLGHHTIVMADGMTIATFKLKELTEAELRNLENEQ